MLNRVFNTFIKTALLLFLIQACSMKQEERTLRLAHALNPSHPVHQGMQYMAERVKEKSDGKLRIKIYPSQQLGSERECLELLQIGSLAMTKVSAAVMEGFVPAYKVLGLPYIFRNDTHRRKVLFGKVGRRLLQKGEDAWLRGLCFYDAGSRSFYTTKQPIRKPADLKGMKIRVMNSNTSIQMVKAMGGSPTPIAWGELYTALQQGVADGAENNPPSFYLSHHYEVCKYYTLNEHTAIPDVLLISTHVWSTLTEKQKQWLKEAARESAGYQWKVWAEAEQESMRKLSDEGVQIIRPDKAPFRRKTRDVITKYKQQEPFGRLIRSIQAVGKDEARR